MTSVRDTVYLSGDLPGGSRFTKRNKPIWKPKKDSWLRGAKCMQDSAGETEPGIWGRTGVCSCLSGEGRFISDRHSQLNMKLAPNSRLSFLRIESSTSLFDWLLKKHGRILWRSVFSDSARNQALLLTLKEKRENVPLFFLLSKRYTFVKKFKMQKCK